MALFSRRPKPADRGEDPQESLRDETQPGDGAAAAAAQETDPAASVSISVSSFQGLGAIPSAPDAAPAPSTPSAEDPARSTPPSSASVPSRAAAPAPAAPVPAEAPQQTETIPGLRDNVLVRQALAKISAQPQPAEVLEVARQLLQGHLFLRVQGDARTLLSEGKNLPLAIASVGEKQYVLAYSGGAALRASVTADGAADTSAMGQPVLTIIRHVLGGTYAGLIIDHASAPARAVLPRELLAKMVEQVDDALAVKTLLAGERTAETPSAVARALLRRPFWVAVNKAPGSDRLGVAEARMSDGSRVLEVYSHPLEIAARGRGDQPAPMTAEQLALTLSRDAGVGGVVVDPAGPWIRLSRADLETVLATGDGEVAPLGGA